MCPKGDQARNPACALTVNQAGNSCALQVDAQPTELTGQDQAYFVLFCYALFHFTDNCNFHKFKVCGNPTIEQIYWCCLSNSICLLCVSGSHFGNSKNISKFFIINIFIMIIIIFIIWCYYCNCFGMPPQCPYKTLYLIDKCCMCYDCSINLSPISLPVLGPPYSLRHNNIEIRSINNLIMTSKCSSERKRHTSHFKSKARND